MQTRTRVHSPEERRVFREAAEQRAKQAAIYLVATSSLLRTGAAILLPRSGAAGWWTLAACLLPAWTAYLLLCMVMKRCGASTAGEALARLAGKWAARAWHGAIALCLVLEGVSALTTLVTLMDEGVGVAVPPLPLALFTAVMLSLCLGEGGLSRGAQLLRWPMGALLALILADLLGQARADHLFPFLGRSAGHTARTALPCLTAGWPVLLLLETSVPKTGRSIRGWYVPLLACVLLLAVTLAIPHEILTLPAGLADALLRPGMFLSPLNRTLLMCLWMLLTALAAAICASAVPHALAKRRIPWLPPMLLAAFAAAQSIGARRLMEALSMTQAWLPVSLGVMAVLAAGLSLFRRRR